jgi:LPS export ABC transporter permease LptG
VRILDKYLLRELLLPLLYCFDAFLLLAIVIDLFGKLDEFIDSHAPILQVLKYYLIILPDTFVMIMPISLLLALLFCLSNLAKHHELVAMRASGISLARIAVPPLCLGLAASLLVFGVNELFVPGARERADSFMNVLKGRGEKDVVENFFFVNAVERRDWYVRRFNTRTFEMDNPEIHDQKPDGTPLRDIYAQRARWHNDSWTFYDVDVYNHEHDPPLITRAAQTNFPAIRESPARLAVEGKKPDQMNSAQLRRAIRSQIRAGRLAHLAEYQVTLQYRYAFPFTCIIVVWLGLPLGMRVSRSGPLLGVGVALTLVVAFYFVTHFSLALGKGEHIPPPLAAWLTNVVFGGVGTILMVRAR